MLEPFTYVRDINDIIHYAVAPVENAGERGCSVASAYYPDPQGDCIRVGGAVAYTESVFYGHDSERQQLADEVPAESAERVLKRLQRGDVYSPQYLFLPERDFATVYEPEAALSTVLAQCAWRLDGSIVEAVGAATDALRSAGVPFSALGLYGGLQCGMVKKVQAGTAPSEDVRILVRGTRYTENISKLVAEYADPKHSKVAQFTVPGTADVQCTVRVLRDEGDANDFNRNATMRPAPITVRNARVVDSTQGLSLPFAYHIETREGQRLKAVGLHSRSLGVAAVGDAVQIQGIQINADTIVLSHPDTDYIFATNRHRPILSVAPWQAT